MRSMKQFFLFFLISLPALAAQKTFIFEPLYGTETALVRYPEPSKYVARGTLGARITYGEQYLSGEVEYSKARSREEYPGLAQKVDDQSDRLALGVRSTINIGELGIYFRAGGRASQGETIVTTNNVANRVENPLRLDPYGGAGIQFGFAPNLALIAGVTLVRNFEGKFDSQYTLGASVRFGDP